MSGESLASGVLNVADLLIEARIEGDSRYTLRTSAVAFAKGAEFALNIARRYLASHPTQATGALSEERMHQILVTQPVPRSIEGMIRGEPDAEDFGIPSEFATRAENYARWVATQSLKVAMPSELPNCVAALSSAKREAEPLTKGKLEDAWMECRARSRQSCFEAGVRFAESSYGITAASQVEPEDKQ